MVENFTEDISDVEDILEIIDHQTKGATTARTKLEPKIQMTNPEDKVDNSDEEEERYPR